MCLESPLNEALLALAETTTPEAPSNKFVSSLGSVAIIMLQNVF
jgi:hypothetical protein